MDEQPFADDLREFLRLLTKQKAPIGDRHLSPPGDVLVQRVRLARQPTVRDSRSAT